MQEQYKSTILKAIINKRQLIVTFEYGNYKNFEVDFDPYLIGQDKVQNAYLWGYVPKINNFHYFRLTDIIRIKETEEHFEVIDWAVFYYAAYDEFIEKVEGFENIYKGSHLGNSENGHFEDNEPNS